MVTIKQIADRVGVSAATVSRVLNFDMTLSISARKRQAVIETAEALNYLTPRNRNRLAPHGVSRIALVHFLDPEQELADPYYVGLRLGIERRCQALRIEVVKVYHTESVPDASLLQAASGVIAVGQHGEEEIAWLRQHNRTLVFADFSPACGNYDSVENDLSLAMRKLLGDLSALGYRRFGFIGWGHSLDGVSNPFGEKRCRAFVEWTKEHGGFHPEWCLIGGNTEESGYRLAREMLAMRDRPEALITANDNIAIGAYRAIGEAGLKIPGDVAVASFNDISVAQFLNPPLSTVRLPFEAIGENAVTLLLEQAGGRSEAKRVILASRIVWRGSTRVETSENHERVSP